MPAKTRFIMIGGFLGAGKTTSIARLAASYQSQGLRVGIVTNDQASGLVDTESLRSQGFEVGEVAGACFCCSFDELTDTVGQLSREELPDVVLAEPVGSCTDLVATVVLPLERLYGEKFDIAPYGVILKPSHGLKILRNQEKAGFSPKAAYIFRKQLEEADFVLLNQIDRLSQSEIDELQQLLSRDLPGVPVLPVSARDGAGFEAVEQLLAQQGAFGRKVLDIDYDIYAAGEAELGWLNSTVRIESDEEFALDSFLLGVVNHLRAALAVDDAETAHLKTIGLWEGYFGVANLTSSDAPAELSLPSNCQVHAADVVVNARVATAPEALEDYVVQAITAVSNEMNLRHEIRQSQSFRPGRPVPTHRDGGT